MNYYNNDKLIELENEAVKLREELAAAQAREEKLRNWLSGIRVDLDHANKACAEWGLLTIESQAREAKLREALNDVERFDHSCEPTHCTCLTGRHAEIELEERRQIAREALTIPHDNSALRLYVEKEIAQRLEAAGQYVTNDASRKAALKAERERCAKACENNLWLSVDARKESALGVRCLGDEA